MNYVIDTSVAFKWAIAETDSDKAISLRDDFRKGIHQFLCPICFLRRLPTHFLSPNDVAGSSQVIGPFSSTTSCDTAQSFSRQFRIWFDPKGIWTDAAWMRFNATS